MSEATKTIESSLSVESIRRGSPWIYFEDYQERYTTVISTLGRECRDWAEGETEGQLRGLFLSTAAMRMQSYSQTARSKGESSQW